MTTTDPTPLAAQIAREHAPRTNPLLGGLFECACDRGQMFNIDAHAAHIATVTEQAIRERVADDLSQAVGALTEYLDLWSTQDAAVWATTPDEAAADILERLARIAQGGTHA